jgi:salicylate hydroxylase
MIGENISPLRYLDCIVILGICPLNVLHDIKSPLLDGATVFQTVNGHERIYMMPYDENNIMWQLSFPMPEKEAKILSKQGPVALRQEGIDRL